MLVLLANTEDNRSDRIDWLRDVDLELAFLESSVKSIFHILRIKIIYSQRLRGRRFLFKNMFSKKYVFKKIFFFQLGSFLEPQNTATEMHCLHSSLMSIGGA
jgi:hypothetical protein